MLARSLGVLVFVPFAIAGLFGGSETTSAVTPAVTNGTSSPTNSPEVEYLLTFKSAQISSMSCLVTLFNMTSQPIGDCLALSSLSQLVVGTTDDNGGDFSAELNTYLGKVCGGGQCSEANVKDAQGQLGANCAEQNVDLIHVLSSVLANYQTSYHTLACSVHFNGTADLCLPVLLKSNDQANNNTFFNNLVSGGNLEQYTDSIWKTAGCIGCLYEMFKAAVYTIPAIRGNQLTHTIGDHLQNDCRKSDDPNPMPNWDDVQDQNIPKSLTVQQNTAAPGAGSGALSNMAFRSRDLLGLGVGALGLVWLGARGMAHTW